MDENINNKNIQKDISRRINVDIVYNKFIVFVGKNMKVIKIIIWSLVLLSVFILSLNLFKEHKIKDTNNRLNSAVKMSKDIDKLYESDIMLKQLDNSVLAHITEMKRVELFLDDNKVDEAIEVLNSIRNSNLDKDTKNLATIKILIINGDKLTIAEFEDYIEPVISEKSVLQPLARLLLAMKFWEKDNIEQANLLFDLIIEDDNSSVVIKSYSEMFQRSL
ncbi:MAG: hypothetical protein JJV93_03205 [Alphaproteobacteria bacterium]|nr:hypothetical protein [Alphaproteobacteria bacterium]MBL0718235.1 hypothetical protein [Alphaproteobacteria bacterium]